MTTRSRLAAEKAGLACVFTALSLGWFLALDVAGVELGTALLAWVAAGPFLLYPLQTRVARGAVRAARVELEEAAAQRTSSLLHYLAAQTDPQVRAVLDACDRLQLRCRANQLDPGRVSQELSAIQYQVMRLRETVTKTPGVPPGAVNVVEGAADGSGRPRQREAIQRYVRQASGLAGAGGRP